MPDETDMTRTALEQTLAFRAAERERERREIELRDMAADQVEGILKSLIADPTALKLEESILAGLIEGRPLPLPQAVRIGARPEPDVAGLVDRLEAVLAGLESTARRMPAPGANRDTAQASAPVASQALPPERSRERPPENLFEAVSPLAAPPPRPAPVPAQPAAKAPRTVASPPRAGSGRPRGNSASAVFMALVNRLADETARPVTVAEVTAYVKGQDFSLNGKDGKYVDDLLVKYAIKFPVTGGEDKWWPSERELPDDVPFTLAVLPRFDTANGQRVIQNWNNAKEADKAIAVEVRGSARMPAGVDGIED